MDPQEKEAPVRVQLWNSIANTIQYMVVGPEFHTGNLSGPSGVKESFKISGPLKKAGREWSAPAIYFVDAEARNLMVHGFWRLIDNDIDIDI